MIYLDYSANTPADQAVLARYCQVVQDYPGNPNSTHPAGKAALCELERVTDSIAGLLGVQPSEIIYTSGASESNNLAIKGLAHAYRHTGKHIISTALEHSSVSGSLAALRDAGYEIDLVSVRPNGTADPEHLAELLRPDTVLISLSSVNSELGTIQPLAPVSELLRGYPDCRLHLDATQAVGKIPVSFDLADTVSFAPHKFYGLNGSGILLKRRTTALTPLIHGGTSTTLYRSGTPDLAMAAACEAALTSAIRNLDAHNRVVCKWNHLLREAFRSYPRVRINSPEQAVPHILNLSVSGVKGTVFQRALSERGVCVSVKSACSADGAPSRAVYAVTGDRKNALSSFRISLSHKTTREELDTFLSVFDDCYKELTK